MAVTLTNPGETFVDRDGREVGPSLMTVEAVEALASLEIFLARSRDGQPSPAGRMAYQDALDQVREFSRQCGIYR